MRGVNDQKEKLVYIIIFEDGSYLRDKVLKICGASSNDPM